MSQRKIDEIFKVLPNVFGNADDSLVLGYDVDGNGDMVAKWIVHGTLNMQVMGLSLSAASWLTI